MAALNLVIISTPVVQCQVCQPPVYYIQSCLAAERDLRIERSGLVDFCRERVREGEYSVIGPVILVDHHIFGADISSE